MKNKILLTSAAVLFLTAQGAFASSEVQPEQDTPEATASLATAVVDEKAEATTETPTAPLEKAKEEKEEVKSSPVKVESEIPLYERPWYRNMTYYIYLSTSYELLSGNDFLRNMAIFAMTWYSRPPKELIELVNEKVVSPIKARLAESEKKKKEA